MVSNPSSETTFPLVFSLKLLPSLTIFPARKNANLRGSKSKNKKNKHSLNLKGKHYPSSSTPQDCINIPGIVHYVFVSLTTMQSNQCNVHDVGRFVGHEKTRWAQKRRRGQAKLGLMHHREWGKYTQKYALMHPSTYQLKRYRGVDPWASRSVVVLFLQYCFVPSWGVTQPICGELVHNMASWVCAPRYLRAGCCCWCLAALQVM